MSVEVQGTSKESRWGSGIDTSYHQCGNDNATDGATAMPLRICPFLLTNDQGTTVIRGYNIFVEDWNDGDYNDLVISLVATLKPT